MVQIGCGNKLLISCTTPVIMGYTLKLLKCANIKLCSSQRGSFMIFLPLRFSVKSISGILEVQNLPFSNNQRLWILIFMSLSHFSRLKFTKLVIFTASKIAETADLHLLDSLKLISRKKYISFWKGKILTEKIVILVWCVRILVSRFTTYWPSYYFFYTKPLWNLTTSMFINDNYYSISSFGCRIILIGSLSTYYTQ